MTLMEEEKCYMILDSYGEVELNNEIKLKENIEKGNKEMKLRCLKSLVIEMMKGYRVNNSLLMSVIRFISPHTDHEIKKMLLLFWELLPKTQSNGNLITEMILVVDSYRRDLEHPNEYIRSFTLRFLCKVNNREILESLMPSIKNCLTHTKNFVRRNAIVTICTIYRKFPHLIANAPELIMDYLKNEHDTSCVRNAFLMLLQVDKKSALIYLKKCLPQILEFDSSLQLVTIEVMLKSCKSLYSPDKSLFLPIITSMMLSNKTSNAVKYEASNTLMLLSSPSSIDTMKNVIQCYVGLLFKESDNNIRLVLLKKIKQIVKDCQSTEIRKTLSTYSLDILSLLSQSSGDDCIIDLNIAQCILNDVQSLVTDTSSCIKSADVIMREIVKLQSKIDVDKRSLSMKKLTNSEVHMIKYLNMLIDTLYQLSEKCTQITHDILPILIDTIYTTHKNNALKVLDLIKLYIEKNPKEKITILEQLVAIIDCIPCLIIIQGVFMIFILYCDNSGIIEKLLSIVQSIVVIESSEKVRTSIKAIGVATTTPIKTSLIMPDGSYASQNWIKSTNANNLTSSYSDRNVLHFHKTKDIVAYSFTVLTSFLMVHSIIVVTTDNTNNNIDNFHIIHKCMAQSIFIITLLLENITKTQQHSVKGQWREKILANLHILCLLNDCLVAGEKLEFIDKVKLYKSIFVDNRNFSNNFVDTTNKESLQLNDGNTLSEIDINNSKSVNVDNSMNFTMILFGDNLDIDNCDSSIPSMTRKLSNFSEDTCEFTLDLPDVINPNNVGTDHSTSILNNIIQLTGLSDPVYVEAITIIKSFEVILDILVVNRTQDTLQNVVVEVIAHGKNAIFSKSNPIVLASFGYSAIKLPIKVTSLENGTFFGNIFYDVTSSQSDRNCVVLNPIYLDVTDYTKPFSCSQDEFLTKWKELDWENTIHIRTEYKNMTQFIENILKITKMTNLTSQKMMDGDCSFMVCNAGIISSFNEEALVNISMEQSIFNQSSITGIIRLRAGTEGMVLNIGEKLKQCMHQTALDLPYA